MSTPRPTYRDMGSATDRASTYPDSSTPRFSNDLEHLLAICRASAGRGFPIAPIRYPT
jgi:hypothetical protein